MGMLEILKNAWKIPDLRKKLIFTVCLLLVYRIGSHIPVPGLNPTEFQKLVEQGGQLFGFFDIVSGGAFKLATIFAMSITPYINSSIIMQLLTVAIPKLEQLAKEGEEGRKIIAQYTRYGTVILAFIQAVGLYFGIRGAVVHPGVFSFITITLTFTAGTAFLMWLGEQITEYGIGNGISLMIFAGIISRGPAALGGLANMIQVGITSGNVLLAVIKVLFIIIGFLIVIAGVVWVSQAERRIPVQYAKRVVGRKVYGGQSTHIPIKVNLAGVIPIIFAMSIMMFPSQIISFFFAKSTNGFVTFIKNFSGTIWYQVIYALLIMFFTFFYTMIVFNPIELANNMKKNGGFIPGIRPGKPTSDYISRVLNRVTWFGALFLAVISVVPVIVGNVTDTKSLWMSGTAFLILVGVALDTIKQMESQMLMRHYKGFLE
ncbi:MAG: preprotein translocase subunit SecY [Bacillota bacterium]|nr:preprotein translocase subunit SecY [Bacillota bacterium]